MRKLERQARKAMRKETKMYMIYSVIGDALYPDSQNDQIGYPPESDSKCENYFYLCGCDDLKYLPQNMVHFTEVRCRKAKIAYCVYKDDIGNIRIRKHPIGQCPDGKYRRRS